MVRRCYDKGSPSYPRYGALGIRIPDSWKTFAGFLADMGERPEGRTLDRIDNRKSYSKENCRWATRSEQSLNRKSVLGPIDREAVANYVAYGDRIKDVAARYRINRHTVRAICREFGVPIKAPGKWARRIA